MDLDRLVIGGHSFGGMTAIATAKMDPRIKACITMDPWLYVYHNEINRGDFSLNVPIVAVSTQHFHPFCE
jgi:cephalosporin-C deacetylase-like acetyl esterase